MSDEELKQAMLVVRMLNAVLTTGGNLAFALQAMSTLLLELHATGRKLELTHLHKLFDEGDEFQMAAIARAKAALGQA